MGNQQSQDYIEGNSDYPGLQPLKISTTIGKTVHRLNNQNKLSQSQKLELQKFKEPSKASQNPNALKGQHRKSYGLEFIEIKKEIQEELKTIEPKGQPRNNLFNENTIPSVEGNTTHNCSQELGLFYQLTGINLDQIPKRLKIKNNKKNDISQKIGDSHITANTGSSLLDISLGNPVYNKKAGDNEKHERGEMDDSINMLRQASENSLEPQVAPVHNIIVLKKSKIRKFMKLKKKEKLKELQSQQQNEILRTIKMQENISKLNEFCKKNIQKQLQKKRNTTIQHQNNISMKQAEGDRTMINQSKISGRKIAFEKSKQIQQPHEIKGEALMMFGPDNEEDSSRLSTEFYEEYYRLLNSLKKDEQIPVHYLNESVVLPGMAPGNISRANALKSPTTKSLINQNKTTLIISPNEDNRDQPSAILKAKVPQKLSKSSLAIHQGRARSRLQKQMKINPNKINLMKNGTGEQQKLLNVNQILKAKSHKIKIPTVKTTDKNKKSLKLSIKKKDNSGVILKQDITNQVPAGSFEISNQKLNDSLERPMTDTELELLNIFINKQASKIQNAFRKHLLRNRFYKQPVHYEDIESAETVKREQNRPSGRMVVEDGVRSKSQSVKTIVQKISESEIAKSTARRVEEENASYEETVRKNDEDSKVDEGIMLAAQLNANTFSEENEYYDEDGEEDENNGDLIIINDQQFIDDDKKVVYLSNINSCSLPQTPKVEEQQINEGQENLVKNSELKKVCFDYIQKNGFILEQINNNPNNFQNFLSHSSSQLQDSFSQIHVDEDYSNQESN